MRLRDRTEKRQQRAHSADVLRPTAELEDGFFNPERDIQERDWQIAEILARETLSRSSIHFDNAATLASRLKFMELMSPERARAAIPGDELTDLMSKVLYSFGIKEQQDRGARAIWADLHTRGIDTPRPFELSAILEYVDHLLVNLTDGKNRFSDPDVELAQDIRACLQMYSDQTTTIQERLNKGKFWETMFNILHGRRMESPFSVVYLVRLAAELCLIDSARANEVKAIISPHWKIIMENFRRTQRIAEQFELFDPKQLSDDNEVKVNKIIQNEVYPSLFHKFATAVHILSADQAGIDGQGRIKVVPHKLGPQTGANLPERSLAA